MGKLNANDSRLDRWRYPLTAGRCVLTMTPLFLVLALAPSCGRAREVQQAGRVSVIATIFPLYDFAKAIGGNEIDVRLLLPPGVEAHSYEPTPGDMARLNEAGLFIYTNAAMEPWAPGIAKGAASGRLIVLEASAGIALAAHRHGDGGTGGNHEGDGPESGGELDPHVWLDPSLAMVLVDNIEAGLSKAAPSRAGKFAANARELKDKLGALDADFASMVARCSRKTIVYGGHFAFGYFARRYGLDHVSPYAGFSPDAEPTPRRIAELVETLKRNGTKVVYFGELADPRVARVIAQETGAELLLLHAAHNVSRDELSNGVTYLGIMRGNLERLKPGLGYQ
ncbi:MAG: zinc ABC transporter substrate-binding protein [Spirochaetes bacterium]|nr:zinc ABC transporter substrate-binding protein [Spirochaetota bacterium]